jgi:hypothetical protein
MRITVAHVTAAPVPHRPLKHGLLESMARGEIPGACQRRTPLPQAHLPAQVELQGGQIDDETSQQDSGRREFSKGKDTQDGPKNQESQAHYIRIRHVPKLV